jgi:hypothetical protein
MSRIGRLVGVLVLVLIVIGFALVGAGSREVAIHDLVVGDCFLLNDGDINVGIKALNLIPCDDALDQAAAGGGVAAYVLEVGRLAGSDDPYPTEDELLALVDRQCSEFTDVSPAVLPLLPDAEAWESAAGPFACLSVSLG